MPSLTTAIAFFRRHHEALFNVTVTITRQTGDGEFDPNTGLIGAAPVENIYTGPAQLREVRWEGTDVTTGEEEIRYERAEFRAPHDTPLAEHDRVVVTASVHDADLVGRTYRITDVFLDGWQVVRRAILERVVQPPTFEPEESS